MTQEYQKKILLIDDDEKLGKLLKTYFAKFNLSLINEHLPSDGLQTFRKESPDLVILDVMLPEMDGFEVCRKIRSESNIPIVMLTARGDVSDRVVGLETGADDYIPKPFEPIELVTRIENILSRINESTVVEIDDTLTYKQLKINRSSYEVHVNDKLIDLTTKEYALLLLMCKHQGKIYSRDDIMNELSGIDSEIFSRSVDILVSRLRGKLQPLDYIQTVWGIGYKFSERNDICE
ncbi:MAG: response regulator transcription factor [Gammaproteobacteria bacterium]|nr:response regulator transcription factor [Gammaproteobacteria bacterium]